MNLNAALNEVPAIINGVVNEQQNKTGRLGATLASNISENVDFTLYAAASAVSNDNPLNGQTSTTYLSGVTQAAINIILRGGIVLNTAVNYQANSGLSAGYNEDYLLWNISIGKKILKGRRGDIRIAAFDVLNQNNNIQHV
jgi:hypothetical protein